MSEINYMKEYKVCSGFVTCFAQYIATNAF